MDNKIVDIGINLLENPNKKKRKDLAFFNIIKNTNIKKTVPDEFICPMTNDIMNDPVIISDGGVFERIEINKWFKENDTNPLTLKPVNTKIIISNYNLKKLIKKNYLCYNSDNLNEKILYLIREKLYNNTHIYTTEMDRIIDNMITTLINFLKYKQNNAVE